MDKPPAVNAPVGSRKLTGPDWELTFDRPVERTDRSGLRGSANGWRAVLGIRPDLKLEVSGDSTEPDLMVEAWAGEPGDDSDGVAVLELPGGLAIARIPLCSCGDRGCGNVGIQLAKDLPGQDLFALVEVLRTLPWTDVKPHDSNVLRGDALAALPIINDVIGNVGASRPRAPRER